MEDKAKEYTEKQYYKVDDIDEFNGEPLAVYRAYKQCQEDMAKDLEYWKGEFDHWYKQAMDMADKYNELLNKQG